MTAAERGRGAPADDRGHVLEAGPAGPLLIAADEQRPQPQPASHEQRADAGGPPILWALTDIRSAPRSSNAIGHVPGRLGRVDVDAAPRGRGTAATTSATGCSVPTSWLPHCRCTSAVSGRIGGGDRVDVDTAALVAADRP